MKIRLPENCTIEHARKLQQLLCDGLAADSAVDLDFRNVANVDLVFFQLLHAAEKTYAGYGKTLTMEPNLPTRFADAARRTGLDKIVQTG